MPDLSIGNGIPGLLHEVILFILGLAGLVAVLFIIIGGYQYIMSGANEGLAKKGKTTLTNAVIGLIIIILSYTVISIVYTTLTRNSCGGFGGCINTIPPL